MIAATTRGALLRGSATDALGDETDDNNAPAPLYSDWVEIRRNLARNPRFGAGSTARWSIGGGGTIAVASDDDGFYAQRVGLASAAQLNTVYVPEPGSDYRVSAWLRCTTSLSLSTRISTSTVIGQTVSTVASPDDEIKLTALCTPTSAVNHTLFLRHSAAGTSLVRCGLIEKNGAADATYFDGDTDPYGELVRTRWVGTPNDSESIMETRTILDPGGFADFPCSIIETDVREFDQASQTWRSVRKYTGRVPSNVDVHAGDRIKDLRDGAVYAVEGFERMARGLSGRASVTLKLKRTA